MNNVEHQAVIRPSEMTFDPNAIPCDALHLETLGKHVGIQKQRAPYKLDQIGITRFRLE